MEFYERCSGARMHANFFRPGGLSNSINFQLFYDIHEFIKKFPSRIDEIDYLLTNNRI